MKKITKALIMPMLILLLLAAALAGSLYDYAVQNARMVRETTYQTLANAAEDQIALLKTKLDDQFVHLEIMARYAGARGAVINDEIRVAMELTTEKYGYSGVGLIYATTGEAKLLAGGSFNATDRDYFTKALTGERTIGYVERGRDTGIPVFSLMVPAYGNNRVAALLFACLDPAGFTRLLEARAYDGQSYSL